MTETHQHVSRLFSNAPELLLCLRTRQHGMDPIKVK